MTEPAPVAFAGNRVIGRDPGDSVETARPGLERDGFLRIVIPLRLAVRA
jgi:hypothetical protein